MIELKPCPFCGGKADLLEHKFHGLTSTFADIIGINRSTLNNRYWRGDRGERLFEGVRYHSAD